MHGGGGQNPYEVLTSDQMHTNNNNEGFFHNEALIQMQDPDALKDGYDEGDTWSVPISNSLKRSKSSPRKSNQTRENNNTTIADVKTVHEKQLNIPHPLRRNVSKSVSAAVMSRAGNKNAPITMKHKSRVQKQRKQRKKTKKDKTSSSKIRPGMVYRTSSSFFNDTFDKDELLNNENDKKHVTFTDDVYFDENGHKDPRPILHDTGHHIKEFIHNKNNDKKNNLLNNSTQDGNSPQDGSSQQDNNSDYVINATKNYYKLLAKVTNPPTVQKSNNTTSTTILKQRQHTKKTRHKKKQKRKEMKKKAARNHGANKKQTITPLTQEQYLVNKTQIKGREEVI